MKIKRRRYIQIALALMITLIVGGTMLINSPRVQRRVSVIIATELENHIGTRVSLGGVRWLFPTDIIIDSLAIDDQEGEKLLSVSRMAAKVEWMPLLRRQQLSVRNVRLFSPDINIYKSGDDYNYQFLIDAFGSKEQKEKKPSQLSLRMNTLLLRHAHVRHCDPSQPQSNTLQLAHLDISDLSAQLSLKCLSADSASLIVRHLGFKEQSGLCVDDLYLRLVANRQGITLANFQFDMPHSTLRLDTIWVSYPKGVEDEGHNACIVKGKILPSHITPADLAALSPQVGNITERIHFDADFIGSPSRINLKELNVSSANRDVVLSADAKLNLNERQGLDEKKLKSLTIDLQEATLTRGAWTLLADQAPEIYRLIPQEVTRIGDMTATGRLHHDSEQTDIALQALTDAGNLDTHAMLDSKGNYIVSLSGKDINIAQVAPESPLAQTNIALKAEGQIADLQAKELLKSLTGSLSVSATKTQLLGYEYDTITFKGDYAPKHYEGTLTLSDPNGTMLLNAAYHAGGMVPHYTASLQADSLNLYAMNLIRLHENSTFSTQFKADLVGKDIDHIVGKMVMGNLTMHRPDGDYTVREVAIYASDPKNKMLSLKSDFMDATARGEFTYQSLLNSLLGHLHNSMPILCPSHNHQSASTDNLCLASIGIYNTTPLNELLLIPIDLAGKAQVDILINDLADELTFTASAPQVEYDGNILKGISVDCHSSKQGLDLYAGATLHNEDTPSLTANLTTKATDDKVDFGAIWSSNPMGTFEGFINTRASFARDSRGKLTVAIQTDSTQATLNHSTWKLAPFRMGIAPEHILVDGLHLVGDSTQHLSIDGIIAESHTDTLQISFSNLKLDYLLSLVKLEGISFGGKVSGDADMANLYSDQPYIEANINAQDFTFCDGPMGDVNGRIHWNQDDTQLQFIADVWENPRHTTVVDGIVDFKQNELWIDIAADSTNVSFLNELFKSFMSNIKGNASGHLTVGGPLNAIDLNGTLMADIDFTLTPTNVDYHFNDSLRFTPGVIRFNGIEAFDQREQKGIVTGAVTHNALKDFSFDLYVDVQNILGINLPDTGHDNFYTTIYGTGGVHVKGSPTTPLSINVQAQPEKGSVFALNLASQNVSSSEKFITFTNHSATRNVPTVTTGSSRRRRRRNPAEASQPTHIDITAHLTPDATLKLVMNQAVDDHISATGNGDLQISVHGDDINLFGTYNIDRGFYRLNLQDVINKNFDVVNGSSVSFEGDPMSARLDITARHVVNYVPLKDLSLDMTGNVHVNCLLHIGGTLNAPTLSFDLELPQGTEEEKTILRSFTSTTEQMNQQFIYLLGLGKFYTPDMAQNNQGTTNNMESFISSTISGQINSLLSGIVSNENWNVASNLRAEHMMTGGSDLGGENWDNMEIEGILEGRLLDNRLLINGSFGYRENPIYATNFVGDFDIRYLLTNELSIKGYNKTNDRYFSKTSLTTQGLGLVFQRDFDRLIPRRKRKKEKLTSASVATESKVEE